MRGTSYKPIRPGSNIRIPPDKDHRQRVYCIYHQPNFEIVRKVYIHNNCRCNEVIALRNRVIFDCPVISDKALAEARLVARLIADWLPKGLNPSYDWINDYSGRKRNKYERALLDLGANPIRRSDSYISAFIKAEKIFELKDPRLIQARNARYNLELGYYLKPLEHHLYNIKGTGRLKTFLPPGRLIAKGCNMERRARLISKKMERWHDTMVVSLDASRFDAHVGKILTVEHLIYKRYWGAPALQRLLDWQCANKGRTSTGVRYKTRYGRMSGDMNTALGNCLISVILLACIMRRLKIKPKSWDMLCDGDDVLLFIPKCHSNILPHLAQHYLDFGMNIKVENITDNFPKVTFCQSFPIRTQEGPKMVSNPARVLSRSLVGVKHWAEGKYVPHYLALIGYCELALSMGCPVLQEFALTVLSWGDHLPRRVQLSGRVIKALREERLRVIEPIDITPQARLDFELATGISVEEQRAMENALRAQNRYAAKTKQPTTTDRPPS